MSLLGMDLISLLSTPAPILKIQVLVTYTKPNNPSLLCGSVSDHYIQAIKSLLCHLFQPMQQTTPDFFKSWSGRNY